MLNLSKTCLMVFNDPGHNYKIELAGHIIEQVHVTKFLGVWLDDKLSWESHVNHIIKKMHSGLYAINLSKNIVDSKEKLLIYYAVVHSHLQYGICNWRSMLSKKHENQLQII